MNQKKKLAFVLPDLTLGGIPKAAIPLLQQLCLQFEVTLILTDGEGPLRDQIPPEIAVIQLPSRNFKRQIFQALCQIRLIPLWRTAKDYFCAKNWIETAAARIRLRPKTITPFFDCAIAFFGMNAKCLLITLDQITAKKKIAWIHGDHPFQPSEFTTMKKIYARFDRIFCVSQATRQKFITDFPTMHALVSVFYNIMDVQKIRQLSQAPLHYAFSSEVINLVTVGRVSPEKGQDMIPPVMQKLRQAGYPVHWHVIGDGPAFEELKQTIDQMKLRNCITLAGARLNPMPFIRACDIYVQPSYTEGYCLTILEAGILGKPIVTTNVGGTMESFCENKNILLPDPTPDSIFQKIQFLLEHPDERRKMSENVSQIDFSNLAELDKIKTEIQDHR